MTVIIILLMLIATEILFYIVLKLVSSTDIARIKKIRTPSFRPPYMYDPILGYRYPASFDFKYVRTGKRGFILNDPDRPEPDLSADRPDCFRILLLGGSTVAGSGVSAPDKTISSRLEFHLNNLQIEGIKKFEVINLGFGGYTNPQSQLYMWQHFDIKADYVIVYDGWNDFVYSTDFGGYINDEDRRLSPQSYGEYYLSLKARDTYKGKPLWQVLGFSFDYIHFIQSLALVQLPARILGKAGLPVSESLVPSTGNNIARSQAPRLDVRSLPDKLIMSPEDAARHYADTVKRGKTVISSLGFPVLHALQPVIIHKNDLTESEKDIVITRPGVAGKESRARTFFCKSAEFLCKSEEENPSLDLTKLLNNYNSEIFLDECHMKDEGYDLVAQALLQELENRHAFKTKH